MVRVMKFDISIGYSIFTLFSLKCEHDFLPCYISVNEYFFQPLAEDTKALTCVTTYLMWSLTLAFEWSPMYGSL